MHTRVVIADDHLPVLASVGAAVSATGATVVARARSPDELFAALRDVACDLLICDYAMPVDEQVDGIEMVHRVRTQWPQLPVIMLTTMSNGVLLRALLAQGVRGLIDKAAPALELHAAIRAVQEGGTVVSPDFAEAAAGWVRHTDEPVLRREIQRMLERGRSPGGIAELLQLPLSCVERHMRAPDRTASNAEPDRLACRDAGSRRP
ncbi:response regulator [Lysobacter arvi]|uniref:Response regulator transcription factor n=1 Tax=Lysobacter arvi TaxID=3038776 RepID=A0ABU1CC79_9GAMM|nr:response regulator transcription factor [Lysobacter arvi]MDR0181775.1 response regulator transcription factor [Lysobacter arvi]